MAIFVHGKVKTMSCFDVSLRKYLELIKFQIWRFQQRLNLLPATSFTKSVSILHIYETFLADINIAIVIGLGYFARLLFFLKMMTEFCCSCLAGGNDLFLYIIIFLDMYVYTGMISYPHIQQ